MLERPTSSDSDDAEDAALQLSQLEEPNAAVFRDDMGSVVEIKYVYKWISSPQDSANPSSQRKDFADRLGVFLSDGAEMRSGEYPSTDDNSVTIFPVAFLVDDNGNSFRVHARPTFHGKPKYSFVEARIKEGELWYGKVVLLFECLFQGKLYQLALVSWLTVCSGRKYNTDKKSFTWSSRHMDCVEVAHFVRVVTIVPTFLPRAAGEKQVLHLLN